MSRPARQGESSDASAKKRIATETPRREPKWRKALRLPRPERRTLVRAWGLLLFFDLSLRLLPFRTVCRWARSSRPSRLAGPLSAMSVERIGQLVAAAGRAHLYPMTCLRRSLALQRILAGCGVEAELRLGVRKEEGQLHAHAWLELNGQPIGGQLAEAARHAVLEPPGSGDVG